MNKIFLLVWKNFIIRRRHYIATALEVLIPVLLTYLLGVSKHYADRVGNSTTFPELGENELKFITSSSIFCPSCTVGYAPDNAQTRDVIEQLKSCLPGGKEVDWKGFDDERGIEAHVADLASNIDLATSFQAAIVFEDGLGVGIGSGDTVSYKIRLKSGPSSKINEVFPSKQEPGPDVTNSKLYADSGFIGLQICIDKILVEKLTGRNVTHEFSLQPFPYPAYHSVGGYDVFYFEIIPLMFIFGFGFMVDKVISRVVSEKETGIKELLILNGLPNWMQSLGWMLNSLMIHIISVTIIVVIMFTESESFLGYATVFEHSDPTLWWAVLMLFVISSVSFCFFICSFFTKPSFATNIGALLWYFAYLVPVAYLSKYYDTFSLASKMSLALLPNVALWLSTKVVGSFEGRGVGMHWSNIGAPASSLDTFSLAHVCLMFILNTLLYIGLALYLDNVLPSKFGVRKPWYYIFLPRACCNQKVGVEVELDTSDGQAKGNENINASSFEDSPFDAKAGVEIKNLRKNFGKHKVAVEGVSMKMYENEIFILLGHNGAGKTTTISMLTGMFAPSGGTALVNGYDITKALDKARDNLGLCPQHNMLFDELTVGEHLRFFGLLKGLKFRLGTKGDEVAVETKMLLQKLQLSDKVETLSKNLSGGQKRKLSLGIAFIGKTKVAILDEPTSGLDPEARRAIWDLLQEMRIGRTILLTTHLMEEADILGDRIGIMSSGKLECCGTSMFLKKFYGTGYTLNLSLTEEAKQDNILLLIQTFVPNASMKASHSTITSTRSLEMFIALPTDTATTSTLLEMFTELRTQKEELGIRTVGLALTTMDEVFLKVGEQSDGVKVKVDDEERIRDVEAPSATTSARGKISGLKLVMAQCQALLIKKCIYSYRNWKLILTQVVTPFLILIYILENSSVIVKSPDPPTPLKVTMDSYLKQITLASSSDPVISSHLSSVIGSSYKEVPAGITLVDALFAVSDSSINNYREKHIVAIEVSPSKLNAMFNTIPYHAAPLAINLGSNLLLKSLDPTKDFSIRVKNHPLESKALTYLAAASPNPAFSYGISFLFGTAFPLGLALLAASFIVFPTEEKISKVKQLQMMTGVSPLTYWYSTFLWDFFQVFLVVCGMMICFLIFQSDGFFTSNGGGGTIFLILVAYGFATIPFSYLCSLTATTVTCGFGSVYMIHGAAGGVLSLVVFFLETVDTVLVKTIVAVCKWIGRLFPMFGTSMATMRYAKIASTNGRCSALSEEAKSVICDPSVGIPPPLRQCCENCQVLPGVTCFVPKAYLTWNYEDDSRGSSDIIVLPGIGKELMFVFIMALVYQAILILLEYNGIQQLFSFSAQKLFRHMNKTIIENKLVDNEDVRTESDRVTNMVKDAHVNEDALVVENFCKKYGQFEAVSMLNFGVHHGECFGLLGVNGAGKTTTFEMLTGDKRKSYGNAYALGKTLDKNRKEFLSSIGYCPQFDALIGVLSGRQMLQLFGRLRGMPGNIGNSEADKWLGRMGLLESANVQCQKYSGGMKRRLSVAMAMIGDPPLLLLDEPTSGVDPVSRRQFWKVLSSVRDSGQSIILTSHSMEECEALCSRLGIMVNGQLQCLGGVQHLKNKFAQGYTLTLKMKRLADTRESAELSKLRKEISEKFEPCELKDMHQNVLQYQLLNTALGWDQLFQTMEELKMAYETLIDDYSLYETSLEQIFLSFARKQHSIKTSDASC